MTLAHRDIRAKTGNVCRLDEYTIHRGATFVMLGMIASPSVYLPCCIAVIVHFEAMFNAGMSWSIVGYICSWIVSPAK